ncbi:MAG: DNA mismatch repair protein MutS [Pedobacter sp.]
MVNTRESILASYQKKIAVQETAIAKLKSDLNNVSLSRLGAFIAEILLVALIISEGYHWILGGLLILPVAFFLGLVKRQTLLQGDLNYAQKLHFVYDNEVQVLTTGKQAYNEGVAFASESHPYSSDLDIYGPGSLYALLNRSNTSRGMNLLAAKLSSSSSSSEILERQEAIKEFVTHIEETYHFRAGLQNHEPQQLETLKYKVAKEMPGQLAFIQNKALRVYTQVAPFIAVALLVAAVVYGGILWQIFGLCFLLNLSMVFFFRKGVFGIYKGFGKSANMFNSLADTVKWTRSVKWKSSYTNRLFGTEVDNLSLSVEIKELSKIIDAMDAGLNFLLAPVLRGFLLWDFRCAIRLDKWHKKSASSLVNALETISHFEELISFATLAHNEPAWTFPLIKEQFSLETEAMGHPLIPERLRVANDFELGAAPTTDIVTGSNMAGKSTFLRTVGINMVLAFAGGPVCAQRLSLSIFSLVSYMRIKDSLNDQTSTFKAELNRLKMILDLTASDPRSFVLIDEMLRGTNSKDKYLGSKVFIEKLISQRTPALFATHDLQLSEMEVDHAAQVRNYHFDIQLSEGQMNFDYKLKHGPCKTFNAALLLKEIGLALN